MIEPIRRRRFSVRRSIPAALVSCVLLAPSAAGAICGDPTEDGQITTVDALYALNASVGELSCPSGVCDVDSNGNVSTSDSLKILRKATGQTVQLVCSAIPSDPDYGDQWGLPAIHAPEVWNTRRDCSRALIAVVDTGVDYYHDDLADNLWHNPGEIPHNGKDDDGNGYKDDVYGWDFAENDQFPFDIDDHGTHVSGIIGATGNSTGTVGVCWKARIMTVRFLNDYGFGFSSDSLQAIDYARKNGATVINNSWGGGPFDSGEYFAFKAASDEGIVLVVAAGNDGVDTDIESNYPGWYMHLTQINVAATVEDGGLAGFSNYGKKMVHLAAPGDDILSTIPHDDYEYFSGTSMAAPMVTGAVAMLQSEFPYLDSYSLKRLLIESSAPDFELFDTVQSDGLVNLQEAFERAPFVDYPGAGLRADLEPRPGPPAAVVARREISAWTDARQKYPKLRRAEEVRADGRRTEATMVDDHVIVVLENEAALAALENEGFRVRRRLKSDRVTVLVEAPIGVDAAEAALEGVAGVVEVSPDYLRRAL